MPTPPLFSVNLSVLIESKTARGDWAWAGYLIVRVTSAGVYEEHGVVKRTTFADTSIAQLRYSLPPQGDAFYGITTFTAWRSAASAYWTAHAQDGLMYLWGTSVTSTSSPPNNPSYPPGPAGPSAPTDPYPTLLTSRGGETDDGTVAFKDDIAATPIAAAKAWAGIVGTYTAQRNELWWYRAGFQPVGANNVVKAEPVTSATVASLITEMQTGWGQGDQYEVKTAWYYESYPATVPS